MAITTPPTAAWAGYDAAGNPYPSQYKLPTAADFRAEADRIEKQERKERKRVKAVKRAKKDAARRRQIALDALVRVAQTGDDRAAVTAAETLLEVS